MRKEKRDRKDKYKWHKWFAWRPILTTWVNNHESQLYVWWEYVERRRVSDCEDSWWEYRGIIQ